MATKKVLQIELLYEIDLEEIVGEHMADALSQLNGYGKAEIIRTTVVEKEVNGKA